MVRYNKFSDQTRAMDFLDLREVEWKVKIIKFHKDFGREKEEKKQNCQDAEETRSDHKYEVNLIEFKDDQ